MAKLKKVVQQEAAPVVADVEPEVEEQEDADEGEEQEQGPGKIARAVEMLVKGMDTKSIILQLSGGDHAADVRKDDGTAIVYAHKNGESSARNAVRAARAAVHAMIKLGLLDSKYTPKSSAQPKMSDEERKAKAKARRAARKEKRAAEKAELEALRAKVNQPDTKTT